MPEDPSALPEVDGVDPESRAHLAARYGHAAGEVMEMAARSPELAATRQPCR